VLAVGPPLVKEDEISPGIDLPQQVGNAGDNAGICGSVTGSPRDIKDRVRLRVRFTSADDDNVQVEVATRRVSTVFGNLQRAALRLDRPGDCTGFQGQS
jgi:hypothetical protein